MERNRRRDLNPLCIHEIHIHKGAGPSHERGDRLCRTGTLSDTAAACRPNWIIGVLTVRKCWDIGFRAELKPGLRLKDTVSNHGRGKKGQGSRVW